MSVLLGNPQFTLALPASTCRTVEFPANAFLKNRWLAKGSYGHVLRWLDMPFGGASYISLLRLGNASFAGVRFWLR